MLNAAAGSRSAAPADNGFLIRGECPMPVLRLAVVLLMALVFGILMSRLVGFDIDPLETRSTALTLCDSAGRRPCP
ncbi:hypothetical protein C7I84_22935 [Mesorhizobium ephedrae]|jgi:hypothetical protein|uniref:Uncharacterized protein n=2 Tax=Kumtagia ephedrae TaxID=2116701 RepID=A0A2P7RZQ8_9HYPH|nr:hypothetical protein C7I84_22935 [Mesorhizobium ephedrae]